MNETLLVDGNVLPNRLSARIHDNFRQIRISTSCFHQRVTNFWGLDEFEDVVVGHKVTALR